MEDTYDENNKMRYLVSRDASRCNDAGDVLLDIQVLQGTNRSEKNEI